MSGGFFVISHCDITEQTDVDAIVNAANERMLGGGGVDGAIHKAAGPTLFYECYKVTPDRRGRRCPAGEARITQAGWLPVKAVIHAVGPNCAFGYKPGKHDKVLASTWRNALAIVAENGFRSVAFPSISTGIYNFPIERAALIATAEVAAFLAEHPEVEIRLCLKGRSSDEKKRFYDEAFEVARKTQEVLAYVKNAASLSTRRPLVA